MATVANTSVAEESVSQRFTNMIMKEFTSSVGSVKTTEMQKSLIQGYFMGCDTALINAEAERVKFGNKDKLPFVWNNVLIDSTLAQNIVNYAKLGLDMSIANHLFAIPRMNSKHGKYSLTFQPGYKGREIIARKYSIDEIVDIVVEPVYTNDVFKVLKKDSRREYDTYEFDIVNPFDRGEIIGGFGYIVYTDKTKNKLVVMDKAKIDKRRDKAQAKTFWTGWYEEMATKTLSIATTKTVVIDPKKIDIAYRLLLARENEDEENQVSSEISDKANSEIIDVAVAVEESREAQVTEIEEPKLEF